MRYFGDTVKVYLFGSRLDDQKRGGDIDLFIVSGFRGTKLQEAKLRMITDIQMVLGDRKIDVMTKTVESEKPSCIEGEAGIQDHSNVPGIILEAEKTGQLL